MSNQNPSPETRFKPGESGNPGGRPKGKSIKTRIYEIFDECPELFEDIVKKLLRDHKPLVWQMLEGRPRQGISGEDEQGNIIPLLYAIRNNNGDTKDLPDGQADQSDSGGDVSR